MMTRSGGNNRGQLEFTSLEELVPEDHLVRKLEKAIDWSFIYDLVEDSYCENNGRPSLDPVILLKLPVLQYMFGVRIMRQTIQEIKVNNAYRWFLGLGLHDAGSAFQHLREELYAPLSGHGPVRADFSEDSEGVHGSRLGG